MIITPKSHYSPLQLNMDTSRVLCSSAPEVNEAEYVSSSDKKILILFFICLSLTVGFISSAVALFDNYFSEALVCVVMSFTCLLLVFRVAYSYFYGLQYSEFASVKELQVNPLLQQLFAVAFMGAIIVLIALLVSQKFGAPAIAMFLMAIVCAFLSALEMDRGCVSRLCCCSCCVIKIGDDDYY
jgi:hypothetical protein